MKLKIWFLETRPQFLLLSVILVIYGSSVAFYHGYFNFSDFLIALIGLVALHIAVNVINDYYDYKSGIDLATQRTPFSGGSGVLPSGALKPEEVYRFGILCFIFGLLIGVYFLIVKGILLAPIIIIGAISVYFYTTHLAKLMLGEIFAGLGLGTLPVLGSYFVQTGFYSLQALIASIPPGILTNNLLLLNEFPDYEADKKAGRKNFVIALGKEKAVKLYSALTLITYAFIAIATILKLMPPTALISFLTVPTALKAIKGAQKYYNDVEKLIPALACNVKVVLGTQLLLALGYVLGKII